MDIMSMLSGTAVEAPQIGEGIGMTPDKGEDTIGRKEVDKALETLQKYKADKASIEQRIIANELWYKQRHWDMTRYRYPQGEKVMQWRPEPTSAWLFNSIANKHRDAMDNIPTPVILPRERGDEEDRKSLSKILPVVMERNDFEETYSDEQWYKLKNGVGVFGIFWDSHAENGLGDITIKQLDLLNCFWESGKRDIQQSKNFYIVSLEDWDVVKQTYPQLKNQERSQSIDVAKYIYDENVDTADKVLIVDWYYKKKVGTKTVLHFAKIVGDELVYATENDFTMTSDGRPMADRGWYDHGLYPVVFDVLYPMENTPVGIGYVDLCKSPQEYIDKIDQLVLENTMRVAKTRYFVKGDGAVDISDFADLSKELITVNGVNLSDSIQKVEQGEVNMSILNYVSYKVDELKETSGNRDVSQGSAPSGVTRASAISALQEARNKMSRDIINGGYRSYSKIVMMCIELIRQFYDAQREFRIEGMDGLVSYINYSNANIAGQRMMLPSGEMGTRKPIFDIKVQAQRKSPFSTLSQNELRKELYSGGFFNPQMAQQRLMALDLMEFEGKDKVVQKVQENYQMFMVQQQMAMARAMQGVPAVAPTEAIPPQEEEGSTIPNDLGIRGSVENYQTPYQQKLARRRIARVDG